jgi:hypothetical protein
MACPPTLLLISKSSNLIFPTPDRTRIYNSAQINKHVEVWKALQYLSQQESHDNPTTSKIALDDIKEVFLAKEWNSFHLSEKKIDYLHLKDFLKYECELYSKQP